MTAAPKISSGVRMNEDVLDVVVVTSKPPLTLALLVGTNAVVAGLEVAASVAFTFIPPLLLKSGFGETQMSVIFGIGEEETHLRLSSLSPWTRRNILAL